MRSVVLKAATHGGFFTAGGGIGSEHKHAFNISFAITAQDRIIKLHVLSGCTGARGRAVRHKVPATKLRRTVARLRVWYAHSPPLTEPEIHRLLRDETTTSRLPWILCETFRSRRLQVGGFVGRRILPQRSVQSLWIFWRSRSSFESEAR